MLRIGDYTVNITITLPDGEIADLLGIENSDEQLEMAYDTIDWDGIEDELTGLAQRLIAKNGAQVRSVIEARDDENASESNLVEVDDGEATARRDSGTRDSDRPSVWVRFGVTGDSRRYIDVNDISPVLDEIAFGDLPEWGDEFHSGACDHGDELHRIAKRIGIIKTDDELIFDGIDEPAYEEYYDMRSQSAGVTLGIER